MVDTAGRLMSKVVFNLSDNQTGLVTTASSAVAAATDDLIDTRPIRRYFVLFSADASDKQSRQGLLWAKIRKNYRHTKIMTQKNERNAEK